MSLGLGEEIALSSQGASRKSATSGIETMSDSQEKARPEETTGQAAPSPALNLVSPVAAFSEPTDDAPTIISRPVKNQPIIPEDSFAVKLRGRKLAHFELIDPIGVGGMAAVIRAVDTQLDRVVALKILPPEMA